MVIFSLFLSAQNFAQIPKIKMKRKYSVTFSLFIWGKMPNSEKKKTFWGKKITRFALGFKCQGVAFFLTSF
jgi:hypothetical protein